MKRQITLFTLIVLVLGFGKITLAQETNIKSSEFSEIRNKSYKLQQENSYRSKEIRETFIKKGSELKQKATIIQEHLPPDKSYYAYKTTIDGKVYSSEYLTIGEKQYVRMNGEKWKTYTPEYGAGAGGSGKRTIKLLDTKKIGKKTIKIYELYEKLYTTSGNTEDTTRFWFDEKGFLLKTTYKGKSLDEDELQLSVTTYDYDAIIKIEEPKVDETPKTRLDARIESRNANSGDDSPVIVKLFANQTISLNDSPITKEKLTSKINNLMAARLPFQEIIYVSATADSKYERIVEIIKLGRQANVDDFGLILSNQKLSESADVKVPFISKSDISKPNPLILIVTLDNKNQITINNEKQTEKQLVKNLRTFFKNRTKQKIYREGSTEIEKTVFIKASPSANYRSVLNIIRLVEKAGAEPIALQIDSLSENPKDTREFTFEIDN